VNVSDVRIPHARLIVAGGALCICLAILWLARGYTFYFDEWDYILAAPDWTWVSYLEPHNVHPAMLHRLIYAALLNTVGMRSYLPYMVVLLALHATAAFLLFEVVRRRAGDLTGLAAAALLLVLGAGWENILWAFQSMFVGSVVCGLAMLLVLQGPSSPRRMLAATVLLTASLMFSGIGAVFGVTGGVLLAATPARRRDLLWFVPVAILFGAWFVAFGRGGAPTNPPPSAANVVLAPLYALWGLGASAAGLIGEGGFFGPVLLVVGAIALALTWRRRRPDAFALGVAAGLLAFYVLTGLTRAQLGIQQAGAGRYVYVGAVFWLLLLADAARSLPWRGTWRPALVACLFLACFNSSVLLYAFAAAKTEQMQREAGDLQVLAVERHNPCLNPDAAVDPLVMPQVDGTSLYYRAVDRFGDPAAGMPASSAADFARGRANLLKPGCI
jgi:hypothetical protein